MYLDYGGFFPIVDKALFFSQEILGVLWIIQEPFFSALAPPRCSLKRDCLGNIYNHILDAHRIYCKLDLLHDGTTSQNVPHGQSDGEVHFFGISKSDLAGDTLGFRHLNVKPGNLEQSLDTMSSYTRGTNGNQLPEV